MEKQVLLDDFSDDDKVESNLNLWNFKEEKEILCVVKSIEKGNFGDKAYEIGRASCRERV